MKKDITTQIKINQIFDEEVISIECICGEKELTIDIYDDSPAECPSCKRKIYFRNNIKVYEIINEKEKNIDFPSGFSRDYVGL